MGNSDGFYLVNCEIAGSFGQFKGSGVAYFKDFKLGGGNDDARAPDEFKLISGDVGGNFINWETGQTTSVTFGSGMIFEWSIDADAQSKNVADTVGWADKTADNFENFQVFKDTGAQVLFSEGGMSMRKIYYVN